VVPVALILTFGPNCGAHFNPAVSIAGASQGGLGWPQAALYLAAQPLGAVVGVALADVMFGEPVFARSQHTARLVAPSPAAAPPAARFCLTPSQRVRKIAAA
jgi:glycerol uptake facilitator-like aquaporin